MFIIHFLKKIAAKTSTILDDVLIGILEKPFIFGLFIAGFSLATARLDFTERGNQIVANITEVLVVLLVIWVLIRFVDAVIEHYLSPLIAKSESHIDDQILPLAKRVVNILIMLIGLIFLIKELGYDVTSLIAGLGIGGLAFALAAQPLLTNLFGGLAIIGDKPFHMGDRIRIDDKYEGYVKQIGLRSTTIRTGKGTNIIIPNSVIASTALENISTNKEHAVRHTFTLGLTYNTPAEKIKEAINIIKGILEKHPDVVINEANSKYYVSFSTFENSALTLSVGYSHLIDRFSDTRTSINLEIKERFEAAGIEFAYPTQTVYVKN
jgi:MscS family membrane protein